MVTNICVSFWMSIFGVLYHNTKTGTSTAIDNIIIEADDLNNNNISNNNDSVDKI